MHGDTHRLTFRLQTRANQSWGECGEASIRARRSWRKPEVPKRKMEDTGGQKMLFRSFFLKPPGIGPHSQDISSFRPNPEQYAGGWRDDTWRSWVRQMITKGQLDLFEDKQSWALEEHLLHLLACLGLSVFCLWPWAGCLGTEPSLSHLQC